MRILSLRFKNLNSLAGEWKIDFTNPNYLNDGIFAIVGPTGAGKSTILDAICLALYGRTPRLPVISASTNEIMTRHTGECFAEVEFSTIKGSYRVFWGQHRAFQKADGALQGPKRELVDLATGEILETRFNRLSEAVENITGLDFDRFTRSIMLAQGAFAAFLQASPSERAPVLEQITGTDIYTDISIAVYNRNKDEEAKKKAMEESLEGMDILSDEEEKSLSLDVIEKNKESINKEQESKKIQEKMDWLARLDALEKASKENEKNLEDMYQKLKDFEPQKEILARGEKARDIIEPYLNFEKISENKSSLSKKLDELYKALPEAQKDLKKSQELWAIKKEEQNELGKELQVFKLTIRKVRDMDLGLKSKEEDKTAKNKKFLELQGQWEASEKKLKLLTENHEKSLSNLGELHKQKETIKGYESLEANIERLVRDKNGIDALISKIEGKSSLIKKHETEKLAYQNTYKEKKENKEKEEGLLKELEKIVTKLEEDKLEKLENFNLDELRVILSSLEERERESQKLKVELRDFPTQSLEKSFLSHEIRSLKGCEDKLLAFLEKIQERYEALTHEKKKVEKKLNFAMQVEDLAELRKNLQKGEACPLCGSLDHPKHKDFEDISELAKPLEKIEKSLENLNKCLKELNLFITEVRIAKAKKEARFETKKGVLETIKLKAEDLAKLCDQLEAFKFPQGGEMGKSLYLSKLDSFYAEVEESLSQGMSLYMKAPVFREFELGKDFFERIKKAETFLRVEDLSLIKGLETEARAFEELGGWEEEKLLESFDYNLFNALDEDLHKIATQRLELGKLISSLGDMEKRLLKLGEQKQSKYNSLQQVKSEIDQILLRIEERNRSISEEELEKERLQEEAQGLLDNLQKEVALYGWQDLSIPNLDICIKDLENKSLRLKKLNQKHEFITKAKSSQEEEIRLLKGLMDKEKTDLAQAGEEFSKVGKEYKESLHERILFFDEKNPDEEEAKMLQKQELMLRKIEESTEELKSRERLVAEIEKNIAQLSLELQKLEVAYEESRVIFEKNMVKQGFGSLEDFEKARLPVDTLKELRDKAESLKKNFDFLLKEKERWEKELDEEKQKSLTEKKPDELSQTLRSLAEEIKILRENIGANNERLNINKKNKELFSSREKELSKQRKECRHWASLNNLIGSHDGKKFRNFAQGLTFQLVVSEANKHLKEMSNRYLLFRDEKEPLELNVMDKYQAKELRPTRTLSGGESFIVSLALALGLAGIASREIRIDSLFLDEGFGALDDETLDIALTALTDLHRENKLIGVISHVGALKERIASQIRVIPSFGGQSILEGAGCQKIS